MKFYAVLLAATFSNIHATPGGAFFDAGSSGTKVITYEDEGNTKEGKKAKFLSSCIPGSPLKGNSAYSVVGTDKCTTIKTQKEGNSRKGIPDTDTATQPKNASEYGKFLATQAHEMSPDASNKDAMPALATAGNRIISKAANQKIWGTTPEALDGLCGQSADGAAGTKIAPLGTKCGTIPGTREALFEAVALQVQHFKKKGMTQAHRVLFTSGGASAQISIPIYTEQDQQVFLESVDRVVENFENASCADGECQGINTPDGSHLPYFSVGVTHRGKKSPAIDAASDFIRFWTVKDIKEVIFKDGAPEARNLPFNNLVAKGVSSNFIGLGTISFIGLAGKGGEWYKGVAGGANQIEEWAKANGCGTPVWLKTKAWSSDPAPWTAEKFDGCLEKFTFALEDDLMWDVATQTMQALDFSKYKVSFGTASIRPKGLINNQTSPGSEETEYDAVKSVGEGATKALELISDEKKYGSGEVEQVLNKAGIRRGIKAVLTVAKAICTKLGHGFGHSFEGTCVKAMWMHKFLSLGMGAPEARNYLSTDFAKADLGTGAAQSSDPVQVALASRKKYLGNSADSAALSHIHSTLKVMRTHLTKIGVDLKAELKVSNDVDFGDADVAKGAAFSFKGTNHLRKGKKEQASLHAGATTQAEMQALGMHILESIATNTVNYMTGAVYAV